MKKRKGKKRKAEETAEESDQSTPVKVSKNDIRATLSQSDDPLMLNLTKGQRKRAKKREKRESMEAANSARKPSIEIDALQEALKHKDVQVLVSHVLQPYVHTMPPDWCRLQHVFLVRKTVVVMVSQLTPRHVVEHSECFPTLMRMFGTGLPLMSPGTLKFVKSGLDAFLSIPTKTERKEKNAEKKVLGRESYLLSAKDLDENGFPISLETMLTLGIDKTECHESNMDSNGYTKLSRKGNGSMSVSTEDGEIAEYDYSHAPMFAIDCEMCETCAGMELTRVSVVDESLTCMYDVLVRPENKITDYKTQYSGITAEKLENVTKRLTDVQRELADLLPVNAILAGHSLENDLHALKLVHDAIIDTTVIYTTPEARTHYKPSLKYLARKYLGQKIQQGKDGHCSIEDAKTVMNLVKLKLEKGPDFGIPQEAVPGSYFAHLAESGRQVYFVDQPTLQRYTNGSRAHSVVSMTDKETVSKACHFVSKADLLWVHLHDIEKRIRNIRDETETSSNKLEACLTSVDTSINTIYNRAPTNTLFIVIAGSGNIHEVKRLQETPMHRPEALAHAVMAARSGLVYVKIKSEDEQQRVESVRDEDGAVAGELEAR